MDFLFEYGFNELEIKDMLDNYFYLRFLNKEEIVSKILILKHICCNDNSIKNIILTNPYYLNRSDTDILVLIKCLNKYGFKNLNYLFDSNPYILNKDEYEVNNYINNRISNGDVLEDIVEEMDNNPYLFDSI